MMATEELAKHLGKDKGTLDAQMLTTYIIVIIMCAHHDFGENEDKPFNFIARMLLMEHFTVSTLGMSEASYSFVTFMGAEK